MDTKKPGTVRNAKAPCHVCGWNDTTARCANCGKPVCTGCAEPEVLKDGSLGGARIIVGRYGRGRVCPD